MMNRPGMIGLESLPCVEGLLEDWELNCRMSGNLGDS